MRPLERQHLNDLVRGAARDGARTALGVRAVDACLHGGLAQDALHEVFADDAGEEAAASGFALALARRVLGKHKWLVWIRQDFSALETGEICASGLLEFGIDPARVLLVRAHDAKGVLRAASDALANKGVGAVILEPWGDAKIFDLVASRRLTLAAQQHGKAAIVLRFCADPSPSAAETRWSVRAAASDLDDDDWGRPRFEAALVRNRHGNTGCWTMEWDCNDGLFKAHPGALAAASADRQAETALAEIRQAG